MHRLENAIAELKDPNFVSVEDAIAQHNDAMRQLRSDIEDAQKRIISLRTITEDTNYTIDNVILLAGRRRFHFGGASKDVWLGKTHDEERWYESYE